MAHRNTGELQRAVEKRLPVSDDWIVELGGVYWYRCVVESSEPFENGDYSRAGWVLVVPRSVPGSGVEVEIHGLRLGATSDALSARGVERLAETVHVPWKGEGSLASSDGKLTFGWESRGEEQGRTTESVLLPAELAEVWRGNFSHVTSRGNDVTGTVRYQRYQPGRPCPWLEEGVSPSFREVLTPKLVGRWGDMILRAREGTVAGLEDAEYVLVDVLAEEAFAAPVGKWEEVEARVRSSHPNAIILRADTPRSPRASLGLGPSQ
jgi:hypothetical protein